MVTTVNIPAFTLELFFGGAKQRRRRRRRLQQQGSNVITQSFSGDSVLTTQVQTFLGNNLKNISQNPQLTYLRVVSTPNGSTIYATIRPNLTLGEQWIAANYSGYTSFQGSKVPTSNDLGLIILNAFGQSFGQADFLAALHSTENAYLQQVTHVRVHLINAASGTQQIQPTTSKGSSSILAGTVIASAICLVFISATVYLIHKNRKKKQYQEKVSLGYSPSIVPPRYIHIPGNNTNTLDMSHRNIFDVSMVKTTCWNRDVDPSAIPSYPFQSIKAPSSDSRGSSSLEQILEENSCIDESVPAVSSSFAMSNTSFNSDIDPNQSYDEKFALSNQSFQLNGEPLYSCDSDNSTVDVDRPIDAETMPDSPFPDMRLLNLERVHRSGIPNDDGVRMTLGISPISIFSSNDDFEWIDHKEG